MPKLQVFNQVSLDGYFSDKNGDMSWAHKHDPEWTSFVSDNASGEATLVFGRITYDMMAGFWPTPLALQTYPDVAAWMNALRKVVFSRTLDKVSWSNTRLVKGDIVEAMRRLKDEPGPDLLIMGSGTIVSQFTEVRLIDEYQIVLNPLVLGSGKSMFSGVTQPLNLSLKKTRSFSNGNTVLWYEPAR